MSKKSLRLVFLAGLLSICVLLGVVAPGCQADPSDPAFIFTPKPAEGSLPLPPPLGYLEGPCGMGVDSSGRFYVSDYYHDTVDAYDQNADYTIPPPPGKPPTGATGYLGQLAGVDAIDGPCALAFNAAGDLYLNDYHRAVKRYGALGSFGAGTTITGATTPEATHPTGVAVDLASGNVYVDQRDHVSVFDSSGAPVVDETEPLNPKPLQIGNGPLKDGYGIAFSSYPGTQGHLYVPDAATNTIEVYDSATPSAGPVEVLDGTETPKGEFVSLRDASIVVDRVTGEIYVVDDLQPEHTKSPQAIVYVFHPDGTYEGHLKSLVTWGMPSGLAVDNSETATQGRVYVTSGNTIGGSIYAYGPGAATTEAIKLPSAATGSQSEEPAGTQTESPGPVCPNCEKEAVVGTVSQGVMPPAASSTLGALPRAKKRTARRHHGASKLHRAHHPNKVKAKAHRSSYGAVEGHR